MRSVASQLVCSHCGATKVDPRNVQPATPAEPPASRAWVQRYVAWTVALVIGVPMIAKGCADAAHRASQAQPDQQERDRRALEGR
jgi:hypothetical protein